MKSTERPDRTHPRYWRSYPRSWRAMLVTIAMDNPHASDEAILETLRRDVKLS